MIHVRHNRLFGGQGRFEAYNPDLPIFVGCGMTAEAAAMDLYKQYVALARKQFVAPPVMTFAEFKWELVETEYRGDMTPILNIGLLRVQPLKRRVYKRKSKAFDMSAPAARPSRTIDI